MEIIEIWQNLEKKRNKLWGGGGGGGIWITTTHIIIFLAYTINCVVGAENNYYNSELSTFV